MVLEDDKMDNETMFWIGGILGYIFCWLFAVFYPKSNQSFFVGFIFLIVLTLLDLFIFNKWKKRRELKDERQGRWTDVGCN